MSYPQPNANAYAANGSDLFRLNTLLTSPGDIYESEQGCHALALGPESDLANVVVNYFDDQAEPTFIQQTTISPSRTFVGRVDSRAEAAYAPIQRPGRILFWPSDIFDPNFKPTGFNPATDAIEFIRPQLDVIQYFSPPASLVQPRIDKPYTFQVYPAVSGIFNLVIPFYGRRYCFVNFTNRNPVTPAGLGIIGVNYAITNNASVVPPPYHQQVTLSAISAVNSNVSKNVLLVDTVAPSGRFDALVFQIQGGGPAPLRIFVSDNVP